MTIQFNTHSRCFYLTSHLHYSYSGSDSFPNVLITEAGFYCVMLCQRSNCCCCVSVCASITSQYFIKMTGRLELIYGKQASSFCYIEISVSPKITVLPSGTLPQNSRLKNFCHGKSITLSTLLAVDKPVHDTYNTINESWLFTTNRSTATLSRFVANLSQNLFLQLTRF